MMVPPDRNAAALVDRHLRVGWVAVLAFAAVGLALETLHGFKVAPYVNVSYEDAAHAVDARARARGLAGIGQYRVRDHRPLASRSCAVRLPARIALRARRHRGDPGRLLSGRVLYLRR